MRLGIPALAKRCVIRRMDRVIRYAKRTPLVESEDARVELVDRLNAIRSDWLGKKWSEICRLR